MKAINLVLGFLIFSTVVSLFFAATYEILYQNNIGGADDFDAMAGEYSGLSSDMHDEDSTVRQIHDASQSGIAQTDEPDVSAYKGAFSGVKLAANFFTNFEHILHNATGDVNTGEAYIDQRITNGILAIILIIIVFVILHFIRGFKTET